MAQRATFQTLLQFPIEHLLFSHWGPSHEDARTVITRLQMRFEQFWERVERDVLTGTLDQDAIVRSMLPHEPISPDSMWLIGGWTRMSIRGIERFLAKRAAAPQ